MKEATLIGRTGSLGLLERARARLVQTVTVIFNWGSGGDDTVVVERFQSLDDEDRGGVILRFTVSNMNEGYIPFAKVVPNGIELHLAGETEAAAFLHALASQVAGVKRHKNVSCGVIRWHDTPAEEEDPDGETDDRE